MVIVVSWWKEVIPMCQWVEILGFCPYETASKVRQWMQGLFG